MACSGILTESKDEGSKQQEELNVLENWCCFVACSSNPKTSSKVYCCPSSGFAKFQVHLCFNALSSDAFRLPCDVERQATTTPVRMRIA